MKKTITAILFAVFAIIAFAACGGGGESTAAVDGPSTFEFEASDIAWDTDEIRVKSGQEVTINVTNVGTLEHNWALFTNDVDPLSVTEDGALNGISTGNILGGENGTVAFIAPAPGEYQFICTVEGHAAAGMLGKMIVE